MSDEPEDDLDAVLRAAALESVLQAVGELRRESEDRNPPGIGSK